MSKSLQALDAVLNESRNGANEFYRHVLCREMIYSDGVKAVAEAVGCYWLLDIIATECVKPYIAAWKRNEVGNAIIDIVAANNKATLSMSYRDDAPPAWKRDIEYTDLPDRAWKLCLGPNESGAALILLTEY